MKDTIIDAMITGIMMVRDASFQKSKVKEPILEIKLDVETYSIFAREAKERSLIERDGPPLTDIKLLGVKITYE